MTLRLSSSIARCVSLSKLILRATPSYVGKTASYKSRKSRTERVHHTARSGRGRIVADSSRTPRDRNVTPLVWRPQALHDPGEFAVVVLVHDLVARLAQARFLEDADAPQDFLRAEQRKLLSPE